MSVVASRRRNRSFGSVSRSPSGRRPGRRALGVAVHDKWMTCGAMQSYSPGRVMSCYRSLTARLGAPYRAARAHTVAAPDREGLAPMTSPSAAGRSAARAALALTALVGLGVLTQ